MCILVICNVVHIWATSDPRCRLWLRNFRETFTSQNAGTLWLNYYVKFTNKHVHDSFDIGDYFSIMIKFRVNSRK